MKNTFKKLGFCFILITLVFDSCKKSDEVSLSETPIVFTYAVRNVYRTQAECGAHLILVGSSRVTSFGICWNTTGSPTVTDNFTSDGVITGQYSIKLKALYNTPQNSDHWLSWTKCLILTVDYESKKKKIYVGF